LSLKSHTYFYTVRQLATTVTCYKTERAISSSVLLETRFCSRRRQHHAVLTSDCAIDVAVSVTETAQL